MKLDQLKFKSVPAPQAEKATQRQCSQYISGSLHKALMTSTVVMLSTFVWVSSVFASGHYPNSHSGSHSGHGDEQQGSSRSFIPVVMKSGIGSQYENDLLASKALFQQKLALKKLIAQEAVKRAEVGRLVFSFHHNFMVPSPVKALLPDSLKAQIPDVNLYGQSLNLDRPLVETWHVLRSLSHLNGYGFDLATAENDPRLSFVRLVNESGLSPDSSPVEKAKVFFRMAMQLMNADDFAMDVMALRDLKSDILNQSALALIEGINQDGFAESPQALVDARLSAAQLKHWAAIQLDGMALDESGAGDRQLTLIVEALELLKSIDKTALSQTLSKAWLVTFDTEVDSVFTLFQKALEPRLAKLFGPYVAKQRALHAFLLSSRLRY